MYLKNINFEKFKSILLNHNINLFDHDFRILFQNFKILDENIGNKSKNLNGGSLIDKLKNFADTNYEKLILSKTDSSDSIETIDKIDSKEFMSPFEIISNKENSLDSIDSMVNEKKAKLLIDSLIYNNFDKAKYICKKKFIPILV